MDGQPRESHPNPLPAHTNKVVTPVRPARGKRNRGVSESYPSSKRKKISLENATVTENEIAAEALLMPSSSANDSSDITENLNPQTLSDQPSTPIKIKVKRCIEKKSTLHKDIKVASKAACAVNCPKCSTSFIPSSDERKRLRRFDFKEEV